MDYIELLKAGSGLAAVIGGTWAIYKYFKRDEHFPRIQFDVDMNFVGIQDGYHVVEVIAYLENKGVVPLKLTELKFSLRGLKCNDTVVEGGENINRQLKIGHKIKDAPWLGKTWHYTFVYPGVRTRYTHVAKVTPEYSFLLVRGLFLYESDKDFHTSVKLVKVPNRVAGGCFQG